MISMVIPSPLILNNPETMVDAGMKPHIWHHLAVNEKGKGLVRCKFTGRKLLLLNGRNMVGCGWYIFSSM